MPEADKTQKATPHRRKKAREEGQVARSRDLGGLLALLGVTMTLYAMSGGMVEHWTAFYRSLLLSACAGDVDPNGPVLFWSSIEVLRSVVPVLLVAMLLSVGVTLAQGGFVFAPAALAPKFERLSPSNGAGQIFSIAAFGNLAKSLLPFLIIALIGLGELKSQWVLLSRASGEDLHLLTESVGEMLKDVGMKAALVLAAWAGVDYILVWRQSESKLRMSHEEIKRESKENDGSPFIKGQVRKRQRAMRRRKPLGVTATATMVITNPTHFAIALRYEPAMLAPEVIAKGRDLIAAKIKAIAIAHDVPVVENRPLARALYENSDVGQPIPSDLYQAVAEILVVVFRAQAQVREQEAMRSHRSASGEIVVDQR